MSYLYPQRENIPKRSQADAYYTPQLMEALNAFLSVDSLRKQQMQIYEQMQPMDFIKLKQLSLAEVNIDGIKSETKQQLKDNMPEQTEENNENEESSVSLNGRRGSDDDSSDAAGSGDDL